jgi:hypothetical protein
MQETLFISVIKPIRLYFTGQKSLLLYGILKNKFQAWKNIQILNVQTLCASDNQYAESGEINLLAPDFGI